MNKMSDEEKIDLTDDEKIELIQQRLKNTKFSQQYTNAPKISLSYILDMETLLELYHKEKEKNKILEEELQKYISGEYFTEKQVKHLEITRKMFWISKDKIEEIIEELEEQTHKIINSTYIPNCSEIFNKNKEKYEPMLEARNILINALNGLKKLL